MRALKVLVLLSLFALISNAAFANLIVDLQAVGVSGGTIVDTKHVTGLAVGSVVTFRGFAQITGEGPSPNTLYAASMLVPETAHSVRGDMSYTYNPLTGGATQVYTASWKGGQGPDIVTNSAGDQDFTGMTNTWHPFSDPGVDVTSPVEIGQFLYTVTHVDATKVATTVDVSPLLTSQTFWVNGNGQLVQADGQGDEGTSGFHFVSGGACSLEPVPIPEPATLVLLCMGGLAFLAIRRK